MADEPTATDSPAKPTQDEKNQAVRAYYAALGKKDKATCQQLVKDFPFLAEVFSAANHS